MGKKSKIAIGIVLLAGLVSVFAFSAAKRGNKAVEVRIERIIQKHACDIKAGRATE